MKTSLRPLWDSLSLAASLGLAGTGGSSSTIAKVDFSFQGLVWSVKGGCWALRPPACLGENTSFVDERLAGNETSSVSDQKRDGLPPLQSDVENDLPFVLALLAFLQVICWLLHYKLFAV